MLHYRIDAGDPAAMQILFFDPSGKQVHSLRVADPKTAGLVRGQISQDLLRMDVDAFRAKYRIPLGADTAAGAVVEPPRPDGAWRSYRFDHRKVTVTKGSERKLRWAERLGGKTKTVRRTVSLDEARRMGVAVPPDVEAVAEGSRPSWIPEGTPLKLATELPSGWKPVASDEVPVPGDYVRVIDRDGNVMARIPVDDETSPNVERALLDDLRGLDVASFEAKYGIHR